MNIASSRIPRYVVQVMSVILSLPTLCSSLIFGALLCYEIAVHDTSGKLLISVLSLLRPPMLAPFMFYMFFGPILACLLCLAQIPQDSQHVAMQPAFRGTRIALVLAGIALGSLFLVGGLALLLRGNT